MSHRKAKAIRTLLFPKDQLVRLVLDKVEGTKSRGNFLRTTRKYTHTDYGHRTFKVPMVKAFNWIVLTVKVPRRTTRLDPNCPEGQMKAIIRRIKHGHAITN